jgi:prepilin-type N-terminal cleavage/methylation domain-containing protein/prepilin-type processing-associated H-X9-DG protein
MRIFTRWGKPGRAAGAFTLVELLVVIAIIGILVALLLPAIQAAREAARRTQCKNQVKQLALGCLLHEDAHKFLPSGGWRDSFSPDPNRGYGASQPGSWVYSILAYIEEQGLRDLGKGETFNGSTGSAGFQQAITKLHQTPVPGFHCPTRRPAKLYGYIGAGPSWFTPQPPEVGFPTVKGDYAANSGDSQVTAGNGIGYTMRPSTGTYASAESGGFEDTNCQVTTTRQGTGTPFFCQSGAIGYHSELKMGQIQDGTSNTYMLGEKYVAPKYYDVSYAETGGWGDNQSVYTGFEWDNQRRAWNPLDNVNTKPDYQPRQDTLGLNSPTQYAFGSAHSGGLNMAMCDGSVHFLSYDIDADTHRSLASRLDGGTAELP